MAITTVINTLEDGTKVLVQYNSVTTPNGQKQIQTSRPLTKAELEAQIEALQAKIALFGE